MAYLNKPFSQLTPEFYYYLEGGRNEFTLLLQQNKLKVGVTGQLTFQIENPPATRSSAAIPTRFYLNKLTFVSEPLAVDHGRKIHLTFYLNHMTPLELRGTLEGKYFHLNQVLDLEVQVDPAEGQSVLFAVGRLKLNLDLEKKSGEAVLNGKFLESRSFFSTMDFNHTFYFDYPLNAQEFSITEETIHVGTQPILLRVSKKSAIKKYCFIVIHDNECTASRAALEHIQKSGGALIQLNNAGKRNILLNAVDSQPIQVDPNRMLTLSGLSQDLQNKYPQLPQDYFKEVSRVLDPLKTALLRLVEQNGFQGVISVHNNFHDDPDGFGIHSFLPEGLEGKKGNTRNFPDNPVILGKEDGDNFFIVTRPDDFERLKNQYNVVLLTSNHNSTLSDGQGPFDDGSFSYLLRERRYINLEVQFGEKSRQMQMLNDLIKILEF